MLLVMIRLLLAVLLCLSVAATARASSSFTSEHDTVTLIAGETAAGEGHAPMLALRFAMQPKWHTYWSNPGDAGAAADARIAYDGGAAQPVSFLWPTPQRLPDGPLMSYGYTGTVTLPITAPAPGRVDAHGLDITLTAEWLVCADVCVPENATFTLHLPKGVPQPSADRASILAARAALPAEHGPAVRLGSDGRLSVDQSLPDGGDAWFLPSTPGVIDQLAAQTIAITPDSFILQLKPAAPGSLKAPLDGVLVIRDHSGAEHASVVRADTAASASSATPPPVLRPASSPMALLRALLLAVAGGLVLNLMPCVFPVLAMKAMAVARMSGAERRHVRLGALFYTAGVLVAFAAIGALTLILRGAGGSVGWGFQFQSVAFVGATAWLLFAVGLNLSGLFEIGTSAMGIGQGLATRGGHLGEAATGLLAVLVATPCTAPFMGVALATALAAPAAEAMVIFLALGLGLALPYLLLALIPRLAASLPKPGAWMDVFRRALAFPVYAAVVWLVWVATQQGGAAAVLCLGAGMVLIALAAWLYGLAQHLRTEGGDERTAHRRIRRARLSGVLALASLLTALALLPRLAQTANAPPSGAAQATTLSGLPTEPFSESRLAELRSAHRPVFVDMSAAWCVTCLVNEKVAFSSPDVRCAFKAGGVSVLRGDWTRYDPAITRFLASLGRDGVPLYAWYPADGGEPKLLPQVLTPGVLLGLTRPCPAG